MLDDKRVDERVKRVNCSTCGRFLKKENWEIGYRENSTEIAYVEGECDECKRSG